MATTTLTPVPRRLVTALVAALFLILGGIVAASPAHAHDTLISSDPADGDVLESSPERITLTYSAEIMDISPVLNVVNADGETVVDEVPTIEGTDAFVDLPEPLAAGDYEVQWRVVSSDGHPIEGTFAITVEGDTQPGQDGAGDGAAADEAPAGDATEGDAAQPESAQEDAEQQNAAAEGEDGSAEAGAETDEGGANSALLPIFVVIGLVVVAGVAIALLVGRRRSTE